MSTAARVSLVAIATTITAFGAPAIASTSVVVPATTVRISAWVDGHCSRYWWAGRYVVSGFTQSSATFSTTGGVASGTVSASANSTGGIPASDNDAADGVLKVGAAASASSSGTEQVYASHHTVGASVRPTSPFPGLPSYVGGSAAFTCATDSAAGIDITKTCSMTYTLSPTTRRWSRTAGSAGSCTVVG